MNGLEQIFDWAFVDPPFLDPSCPPEHLSFKFSSCGEPVYGHAWIAGGAEPKGTVIISTQTFGGDCLESVTFPLLQSGINVISYVPRGMWDRRQKYSMYGAVDDLLALIEYIRGSEDSDSPFGGIRSRIDPDRIALFGLSGGGGNVSFAACAESSNVRHAIAVAPANIDFSAHPSHHDVVRRRYSEIGRPWMAEDFIALPAAQLERISIIKQADRLKKKHLLLIGASRDQSSPLDRCHRPILQALRTAGAEHLTDVILDTDHMIMTKRNALARLLIAWLQQAGF